MKISPGKAASITSLLLLLFFPNFLVLLGYTVNESIFLGIVAGLSGGLIAGWSHTEPEAKQLEEAEEKAKVEETAKVEEKELSQSEMTATSNERSFSEEKEQNQYLKYDDSEEYASALENWAKDPSKNKENSSIEPSNYQPRFRSSFLPKEANKDEKEDKSSETNTANSDSSPRTNKSSIRAQRKGVSLFSWFLMKEGDSSKSHRR